MIIAPRSKPFTGEPGRRQVRSFVLRKGRLTPGQQRALDDHWPRFGLDYQAVLRSYASDFTKQQPLVVEIGFGNGEQLIHSAIAEPEKNFIGIEVHAPGVGRALLGLAAADVNNARVYCHDAVEVLRDEIADNSLWQVRIYFPDPWHKKRHQKRRLIQPMLVNLLAKKLMPGGMLHLATDWADYAQQMWDVCDAEPLLKNTAGPGGHIQRPAWRVQTHFETRGQKLGHGVRDLLYQK